MRPRRRGVLGAGSAGGAPRGGRRFRPGDSRHPPGWRSSGRPGAHRDSAGGACPRRGLSRDRALHHRGRRPGRRPRIDPPGARTRKNRMKVSIIGTGYVGLVTGACLADVGNEVLCLDVDQRKIAMLKGGEIPIFEPGLKEVVRANVASGRLAFTTDPRESALHARLQMIAVGTPPGEDGSADLRYVLAAARGIARDMDGPRVVVDKSTVPVGTADKVRSAIAAALAERGAKHPFY